MNHEIYRRVMDRYRLQRDKNAAEEERRRAEIEREHPDLAALCRERHEMILGGIRKMLGGRGSENADLEERMNACSARIRELLRAYGYPENYLEPVCLCEKCRDTGYLGENVKEMCSCLKTALSRESGGSDGQETFETFDAGFFPDTPLEDLPKYTQRAYMKATRDACERFADRYPEGGKINLLLHGRSGLGKTWLARCVANRLTERGFSVRFATAFRLLDDLRQDYFRPEGVTAEYMDTDFLIIDDLGIEPLFDKITVELILNVLNERMVHGRGTAISTNLERVELKERYTERFLSRFLSPATCLDLTFRGRDMRLYAGKD